MGPEDILGMAFIPQTVQEFPGELFVGSHLVHEGLIENGPWLARSFFQELLEVLG